MKEPNTKPSSATPTTQPKQQQVRSEDAANELASRSGAELPANVRQPLESQFDADFSQVRVHSDRAAAQATSALGARAFTVGRHIAFNQGEYKPASAAGQRLLAHELTHVVQQSGASVGRAVFKRDAGQEHEADTAADRTVQGRTVPTGALTKGGAVRIQADDKPGAKKTEDKPAAGDQPAGGARITFVMRADDAYTRDVTDYVQKTLGEQVVEVDNIQEAADYVAQYAKTNKTKISQIRIVGHGSTTGGIKMTPKGEPGKRFVTAQELADMAADKKITSVAKDAMAEGATVEFYGCYVGRSEQTGRAVGTIFGGAEFKAIEQTLRTSSDSFSRPAEKGDTDTYNVPNHKGKFTDVKSSKEVDDRVAKGNKKLGQSFNQWLLSRARQMEADGDMPPQKDDAARIKAMREVFDRSGGKVKRLEIHTEQDETLHRGDKNWLSKWKTVKVKE